MKRFHRDDIEADLSAFKEAVTDAVGAFGPDFPRKIFGRALGEEFAGDRLSRLSQASRIDLMKIVYRMAMAETTQPTQPEDADEKKRMMGLLAKIYSSIQPDTAYAEYTRRQRLAFRDVLLDDRQFLEMWSGGWNDDIASRPHFLKHVMVVHNRVMSHKSLGFQACGLHFGWAHQGSEASYDNGQIAFRSHWAKPEFTLKNGMCCLLHENTHAHQDQMGLAYEEGRLPRNSPFYQRGKLCREFFRPGEAGAFYVQPPEGRDVYRAQPIEREARMVERLYSAVEHRLNLK